MRSSPGTAVSTLHSLLGWIRCLSSSVKWMMMEIIVPQLAKAYGVTEQLKAENQIEWVRQMNACVAQAEEAIKGELIYC